MCVNWTFFDHLYLNLLIKTGKWEGVGGKGKRKLSAESYSPGCRLPQSHSLGVILTVCKSPAGENKNRKSWQSTILKEVCSIFTLIIILSSLALNIISLPFFFIIGISYSPPSDLPQYSAWQPFSIIIVIVLVNLTIIMIMIITQISGTINKRIICMKLFIPSCAREAGGAEGMYAVINSGNVTHSRRLICLS